MREQLYLRRVGRGLFDRGASSVILLWFYHDSQQLTAFKFTGATTAVSLGFIFPPLEALRLNEGRAGFKPSFIKSWGEVTIRADVGVYIRYCS